MNTLLAIVSCGSSAHQGVWTVAWMAIELVLFFAIVQCVFQTLTLPLRQNERARTFLDLLELGLKDGHSPEKTILDTAATRDKTLDKSFHGLAADLEQGMKLSDAVARRPRLASPQLAAMLKTGERIGDFTRVLPACRQMLNDGVSQVRGALNYVLLISLLVVPFTVAMPIMLNSLVLPRFQEIFAEMLSGVPLPEFTRFIFSNTLLITAIQLAVLMFGWIALLCYGNGPWWYSGMIGRLKPGLHDRIHFLLPWRRKRLLRDFSTMLAVLLDSGVPEPEAVSMAADATANAVMRRKAGDVRARLRNGIKLPEAIRAMDDSGELQWRFANALHRGRDFLRALTGWHEALDARAFQLEQSAAQITTSAIVLFSGAVVAAIVIAVFLALTHLMLGVALW